MSPSPEFPHLSPVVTWHAVNFAGVTVTHRENVALGADLERLTRQGVPDYRPRSPRVSPGLLGALAGWFL